MTKLVANFICLFSFLLLLSCKHPVDTSIGAPKIKAGTAKITGRIISPKDTPKDNNVVEISVPHPISGEIFKYKTVTDQSGNFSIDIDVETDVWIASVKAILSDVVGFTSGQYYDVLAANAYGRQLNEEAKPLTEKQKRNIADYWKEEEIAKILLRKNQQVVKK
ncbi:hypothetical protein ACVWYN_000205 [Pedobacter sp. UYP24]